MCGSAVPAGPAGQVGDNLDNIMRPCQGISNKETTTKKFQGWSNNLRDRITRTLFPNLDGCGRKGQGHPRVSGSGNFTEGISVSFDRNPSGRTDLGERFSISRVDSEVPADSHMKLNTS